MTSDPKRRPGRTCRHPALRCSFCDAAQADVSKLVAGPGVYICDGCIALADVAAAGRTDCASERVRINFLQHVPPTTVRGKAGSGVCSFCGKGHGQVAALVGTPTVRICDECLDLCREILVAGGAES